MSRLADTLVRAVTERPRSVLAVLSVAGLIGAAGLSQLRADFSPEDLVPASPEDRRTSARLNGALGAGRDPLLVLVEARAALGTDPETTAQVLGYLRRLGDALGDLEGVTEVVDLTRVPLPGGLGVGPGGAAGREAPPPGSEDTGGASGGDALTLDDLAVSPEADRAAERAAGEEARRAAVAGALAATAPERFPRGLIDAPPAGLGELVPLLEGPTVSPAEARRVAEAVAALPRLRGTLVGRSVPVFPIVLGLSPEVVGEARISRVVARARGVLDEVPRPEGALVDVRLGGLPVLQAELIDKMRGDQAWLVLLSILANLIVLVVVVRFAAGVVLPLGAVGLTLALVLGGMGWAGERLNLLNNVVPPLLITLGIGDAIHLLGRYREERRGHADAVPAVARASRAMLVACLATSATTAMGFGSLLVSRTEVLRRFGVTAALGVMVAYLVTVLFVPAALSLFPGREPPPAPTDRLARRLGRLARWIIAPRRQRWVFLGAGLVLLGGLGAGRAVGSDRGLQDQLGPDSPVTATTRLLEAELTGIRRLEVGLEVSEAGPEATLWRAERLDRLDRATTRLEDHPLVLAVSSPTDRLHDAWSLFVADPGAAREPFGTDPRLDALRELVALGDGSGPDRGGRIGGAAGITDDGRVGRLVVHLRDAGAERLDRLIDLVAWEIATAVGPGVSLVVTGEAARASRGLTLVVEDLLVGLGVAVVVVFGFLAFLFRSLRLGLLTIPPNLLPLTVVLGHMAWRGIPLSASTAIVFAVSLGLAVDGTIHLVSRYREERQAAPGATTTWVVEAAMRGSGVAVVVGAATLIAGFSALTGSAFVPIRLFGELSVVAIAASLGAELLLMPPLLARYDRRWAPARGGRQPVAFDPPVGS